MKIDVVEVARKAAMLRGATVSMASFPVNQDAVILRLVKDRKHIDVSLTSFEMISTKHPDELVRWRINGALDMFEAQ